MLHSTASDLGLHCFPINLLGDSWLKWVKYNSTTHNFDLPPSLRLTAIAFHQGWAVTPFFSVNFVCAGLGWAGGLLKEQGVGTQQSEIKKYKYLIYSNDMLIS